MIAKRRRPMSEINIVPYVDVMLVLLVIFMATAPMIAQGIDLDLPKEPSEQLERTEDDPVIVSIQEDGSIFLNFGTEEGEDGLQVTKATLNQQMLKVLRTRPDAPVFIRADVNLPYGDVIGVMTVLQLSGAESVGLLTDPPAP